MTNKKYDRHPVRLNELQWRVVAHALDRFSQQPPDFEMFDNKEQQAFVKALKRIRRTIEWIAEDSNKESVGESG